MKALRLSVAALAALAPASASAQVLPGGGLAGPLFPQPGSGSLYPTPIPPQTVMRGSGGFGRGRHRGGFDNGVFIYEQPYVVHEVVVVHDQPAAAPEPTPSALAPPPAPREPYVLGRTYGSLPDGCMKMIAGGASYFQCSVEWFRLVGSGQYKAVAAPL